jgi:hypothetical protein
MDYTSVALDFVTALTNRDYALKVRDAELGRP